MQGVKYSCKRLQKFCLPPQKCVCYNNCKWTKWGSWFNVFLEKVKTWILHLFWRGRWSFIIIFWKYFNVLSKIIFFQAQKCLTFQLDFKHTSQLFFCDIYLKPKYLISSLILHRGGLFCCRLSNIFAYLVTFLWKKTQDDPHLGRMFCSLPQIYHLSLALLQKLSA